MPDPKLSSSFDFSIDPPVDPCLANLREQTKNVMIPLLIKVFHAKLEAQQLTDPPSRLKTQEPKNSLENLIDQLSILDEDLKRQELWIQSSRTQLEKVLSELKQTEVAPSVIYDQKLNTENPAIKKSFEETVSQKAKQEEAPFSWLKKLLGL
jgi:hypothetical protein